MKLSAPLTCLCWRLILISILFGTTPSFAQDCTEYDEYLHWVNLLEVDGEPVDIEIQGDYAYIAAVDTPEWEGSLYVVDISNPNVPRLIEDWVLFLGVVDIDIEGDILVLVHEINLSSYLCFLIDISNPFCSSPTPSPTSLRARPAFGSARSSADSLSLSTLRLLWT